MKHFEKARELAETLLDTDEGLLFKEKKYVFEGDDEAISILKDYEIFRKNVQTLMKENTDTSNTFQNEINFLNEKMELVKQNKVVMEFFDAQNKFNTLINQTMDLLKSALTGETEDEEEKGGCSSGGCGNCSGGCH